MTVNIDSETETNFNFDFEDIIKCSVAGAADYCECPYDVEVNVLLTDNNSIQSINNENRGIDRPTDVLSFPMIEYENAGDFSCIDEDTAEPFNPETGELVLGDIVISCDKVKSQADEYGHSEIRELAFLTVHSMLHLFGYDHMDDNDDQMEKLQKEILEELKISR